MGLDHSFWKVEANWNKKVREGLIMKHFRQVYNYNVPEKWADLYIYGYRKNSPMGIELQKQKQEKQRQLKWSKRI